eukprot:9609706-Karenia_brevis.AAC.1
MVAILSPTPAPRELPLPAPGGVPASGLSLSGPGVSDSPGSAAVGAPPVPCFAVSPPPSGL